MVEQARHAFAAVLTGDAGQPGRGCHADGPPAAPARCWRSGPGVRLVSRPIEQANLVLGCAGLSRTDDRRFALGVLNAALGGGMSSRLFQEIREKRGLAYSVYSFTSQHADTGLWGIYVGCLPSKADEVLAICRDEIAKVVLRRPDRRRARARQGPGARLHGARPGGPVLADEPGWASPSWSTRGWSRSTRSWPRSRRSSHDAVRSVAEEILTRPKVLAVVGPYDDDAPFANALALTGTGTRMIKVGVLGARGRMGSEVGRAVGRRGRPRARGRGGRR